MPYDDVDIHRIMLMDEYRTGAYRRAIQQVVRPHHRVLDFGCGTGILSFFAALTGARTVYAVDKSGFIRAADLICRDNRFENITFFHDDEETLTLPEPADVIVSEWMGHFALTEQMLGPVIRVRDRFLAPGGVMIPKEIIFHGGLVRDPAVFNDLAFFRRNPYGLDFSAVADWPFCQPQFRRFTPDQILGSSFRLGSMDLHTCKGMPEILNGSVEVKQTATVYGVCGWFEARLTDDIAFATGPADPQTHWHQLMFPLSRPVTVGQGRPAEVALSLIRPGKTKGLAWKWSLSAGGDRVVMDDLVHAAWIARPLPRGRIS